MKSLILKIRKTKMKTSLMMTKKTMNLMIKKILKMKIRKTKMKTSLMMAKKTMKRKMKIKKLLMKN